METAEELPMKRYVALKHFMVLKQTGVNVPSLIKVMQDYIGQFDQRSHSGMLITLYNYLNGLTAVEKGEDADQLMFALIVLEKDEDPDKYSKGALTEKIERFSALGITQGEVVKTVENFIEGSPILSEFYFLETLASLKNKLSSLEPLATSEPVLENKG